MKHSLLSLVRARLPGLMMILLGLAGGYLYYRTQLCGGFCPLSTTPFWSVAVGGMAGALLYDVGSALQARLSPRSRED